ncbi:placenta-specific gene 8 protein-like [Leptodactylus fuscus]|uniref:placenta-specific gene 8 protein-like n=1 Tax=Leptodactylus fuscus TaxID=238119 RepID=UPI003F4F378C
MATITSQPGVITTQTVTVTQSLLWSSGLCDCCEDCGICCCALWCFPCLQCDTVSDFGECCALPLLDPCLMGYVGCSGVCPPVTMAMRAAVRERYRIQGSICDDCARSCCCYSCTWCQMAREIKYRSQSSTIRTAQTTVVSSGPIMAQGYTPLVEC